MCSAPQSFGLINAPSKGTAPVHAEPGWPPAAAPECSDSSWWLCRGSQTGGWPCPPSPLCVQLWCHNEIDAFPQIIFPWKQSRWLLWRSCWWIGGSHLGDCSETPALFMNTKPSSQPEIVWSAVPWDLIPGVRSLIQKVRREPGRG